MTWRTDGGSIKVKDTRNAVGGERCMLVIFHVLKLAGPPTL